MDASYFDLIFCILRIQGMSDSGWDPYETTLRAIPKIQELWRAADTELSKHIGLWIYGHIMEASEPCMSVSPTSFASHPASGDKSSRPFRRRAIAPRSPGEKIAELRNQSRTAAGFIGRDSSLARRLGPSAQKCFLPCRLLCSRDPDFLRTLNPAKEYTHGSNTTIWLTAQSLSMMSFHDSYKLYVGGYDRPIEIGVHQVSLPDPDERAQS